MSTQRSLQELISRADAIMTEKTGQSNPATKALACTIAGISYGQYAYQDMLFRQLHPETASEEWLYLHASRHNVDRLLPSFATGFVTFTALNEHVYVPAQTVLVDDAGLEYQTINEQSTAELVEVVALTAGEASNLPANAKLSLKNAVTGVKPIDIICLGFSGGSEIESLERWRQRIITAYNNRTQIGFREDYEAWALSAHNDIDFAWAVDNTPERGQVQVFVGARENDPTVTDEVIATAQEFIDKKRLAGCHPIVQLPKQKVIDVEIQNVQDQTTRDQITVALQDFFKQKMGVRDDSEFPPKQVSITPTELVLVIAPITSNYIVKQPIDEQFINNDEIHVLGEITWTALN